MVPLSVTHSELSVLGRAPQRAGILRGGRWSFKGQEGKGKK